MKGVLWSPAVSSLFTACRYEGLEDLPAFLERPTLSAKEIEAINDGGVADLDAAVTAWSVRLSYQPVLGSVEAGQECRAKRASQ